MNKLHSRSWQNKFIPLTSEYFIAIPFKGGIPRKLFSWLSKYPFCERTRLYQSHLSSIHTVTLFLPFSLNLSSATYSLKVWRETVEINHTLQHTHTHSGGLIWTEDRPAPEASNYTTHKTLDRHDLGGIRTRNPSMREAAYLCLRLWGHLRQSITFCFSETYLKLLPLHSRLRHRSVSKAINEYT